MKSRFFVASCLNILFILILLLTIGSPVIAKEKTIPKFLTGDGVIKGGGGLTAPTITFNLKAVIEGVGQYTGFMNMGFYDVSREEINNLEFESSTITQLDFSVNQLSDFPDVDFYFIHLNSEGTLDGEEGWRIECRIGDFGPPGKYKDISEKMADAIRITVFNPESVAVYDTASNGTTPLPNPLDFPREQSWRVLLDEGNFNTHLMK